MDNAKMDDYRDTEAYKRGYQQGQLDFLRGNGWLPSGNTGNYIRCAKCGKELLITSRAAQRKHERIHVLYG